MRTLGQPLSKHANCFATIAEGGSLLVIALVGIGDGVGDGGVGGVDGLEHPRSLVNVPCCGKSSSGKSSSELLWMPPWP